MFIKWKERRWWSNSVKCRYTTLYCVHRCGHLTLKPKLGILLGWSIFSLHENSFLHPFNKPHTQNIFMSKFLSVTTAEEALTCCEEIYELPNLAWSTPLAWVSCYRQLSLANVAVWLRAPRWQNSYHLSLQSSQGLWYQFLFVYWWRKWCQTIFGSEVLWFSPVRPHWLGCCTPYTWTTVINHNDWAQDENSFPSVPSWWILGWTQFCLLITSAKSAFWRDVDYVVHIKLLLLMSCDWLVTQVFPNRKVVTVFKIIPVPYSLRYSNSSL